MGKRKKRRKTSKYCLTLRFFEKNKRGPSTTAKDLAEQRLGAWVTRARFLRNHSEDKLPEKVIELLDRIDADKNEKRMLQWERNYYNLKDLYEGKSNLPDVELAKLRSWCTTQKQIRKGAIYGSLSEKQIAMLDDIGFVWSKYGERRSWEESYTLLKAFRKKNKKWPVHTTTNREETKLAKWCSKMRAYKNGSDTSYHLSDDQIKKLTRIGFEWESSFAPNNNRSPEQLDLIWKRKFDAFSAFIDKEKRYPNPESGNDNENTLYSWWMRMAHLKRNGKLPENRIQLLNLIGFRWGREKPTIIKKKRVK